MGNRVEDIAFPATFIVLSRQRGGTFLARRQAHFSRTQGLGTATQEMNPSLEYSLRELTEYGQEPFKSDRVPDPANSSIRMPIAKIGENHPKCIPAVPCHLSPGNCCLLCKRT